MSSFQNHRQQIMFSLILFIVSKKQFYLRKNLKVAGSQIQTGERAQRLERHDILPKRLALDMRLSICLVIVNATIIEVKKKISLLIQSTKEFLFTNAQ